MTTRIISIAIAATLLVDGPGFAAPPQKTAPAAPDETMTAEPAGGTELQIRAAHTKSTNNLKQIALAFHNSADANNREWPRGLHDKTGKALLSWRVQILPYLEQQELYSKFKLDEPWDSKHNKELVEKMPTIYDSPRVKVKAKGYTVYQGFRGKGALFGSADKLAFPFGIADGTSNTILAVEATAAVPWSKPVDVPFDEKKDLPEFGKACNDRPLAAICDGSVRVLDLNLISPRTLKAAITPAGGEPMGPDWIP